MYMYLDDGHVSGLRKTTLHNDPDLVSRRDRGIKRGSNHPQANDVDIFFIL